MLNPHLLHGEHVHLEALRPDDAAVLAGWTRDVDYYRRLDSRPAYPESESSIRESIEENSKRGRSYGFGIHLNGDNKLVGFVEIESIQWSHRVAWLAIGIGEAEARGKGYGREGLSLAIDYAFSELNLHRVQLTVFGYNEPAIRLYEKLGFQREGTFRESLHRDGQRYDMYLYGLLRREWEERTK